VHIVNHYTSIALVLSYNMIYQSTSKPLYWHEHLLEHYSLLEILDIINYIIVSVVSHYFTFYMY
jgi:hypothetical protein